MKTTLLIVVLLIGTTFSCNTAPEQITNSEDYNSYLESSNAAIFILLSFIILLF
jgi:uncharacterized lipoprotein